MTLGELIKQNGYTQKWVHSKLVSEGISVHLTHFNKWCKDRFMPSHEVIYEKLSEILRVEKEEIKNCFKQNREE